MTKEDREHEIEDYIQYLETLYDAVLENSGVGITVKVLGFSQGVATVSRWAAVSKKKIDTLILYAGEIGAELQNREGVSKLSKPQNYFVYGTNDKIIPIDKLKPFQELLGNFTFLTFEGGHEINTAVLEKL
jgi:predicted esterase